MSTNTKRVPGIYLCLDAYPILTTIMDNLSATDVSAFVHAFRIDFNPGVINKYINVLRDIPEHLDWIENMVRVGNRVILIGSDLKRLAYRIMDPFTYDRGNEKPLCIWIAVIPKQMIEDPQFDYNHIMTWDGKFELVGRSPGAPNFAELLGDPGLNYANNEGHPITKFICRFDHMEELPTDGTGSDWFISTLPNENNIKVVYFASYHNGNTSTNACMDYCQKYHTKAIECNQMITGNFVSKYGDMNVPLLPRIDDYSEMPDLTYFEVNSGKFMKVNAVPQRDLQREISENSIVLFNADPPTQMNMSLAEDEGEESWVHFYAIPFDSTEM